MLVMFLMTEGFLPSFVILYNSNLDRPLVARKTIGVLRKELKAWEDSLGVKKASIDDNKAYLVCTWPCTFYSQYLNYAP